MLSRDVDWMSLIKCPNCYPREIFGFFQPYCISSSREKPEVLAAGQLNPEGKELFDEFCCSSDNERCPYYRNKKIHPPESPKESDFNKNEFFVRIDI